MDIRNEAEMAIGDTQQVLQAATAWMGSFIATDQRKDKIIQELLRRLEDTEDTMNQLRGDLAAERKSRRDYQMESDKSSQDMKRLEQKIVHGDGAKFADQYLRSPLEGGPVAAQALKQAVRDYLQTDNHDFNTEDIPIIVRAYANLNDLAKSLRLSNVIDRDEDMRTFAEQFTNSRAEVDFVNVGRGKENADSKLRKMLNHYLRNLQCKKIFVACCHDNGYLHDLREYSDYPELRNRIVLVETTPAEQGFKQLPFDLTSFNKVFRSNTLLNESKRAPASTAFSTASTLPIHPFPPPATQPDYGSQRSLPVMSPDKQMPPISAATPPFSDSTASTPATMHADTEPQLTQLTRTASVLSSGNGGVSISYAKAGGSESLQNIDIAAKPKKMTKTMLFNSDGHRIDPPTKHPANTPAQQTYQSKLEKVTPNAFCNDHYLVGKCKRPNCERVHDVDLGPQEVAIHRYKARTSVCPRGPIECFDYDCYLSHHCLKDPRCTRGPGCKFTNTEWGNLHLDTNEKLTPSLRWTDGVDFPDRLN
ncbi:hypothetical protein PG993_003762 [Apiospora rasikravindrae]|uniref:C3H1-type domain-containing protein n=1 Tax=Apiospora rasikravindrae TaxID=990691 RepID=A0ABR1U0G5_9PEZI